MVCTTLAFQIETLCLEFPKHLEIKWHVSFAEGNQTSKHHLLNPKPIFETPSSEKLTVCCLHRLGWTECWDKLDKPLTNSCSVQDFVHPQLHGPTRDPSACLRHPKVCGYHSRNSGGEWLKLDGTGLDGFSIYQGHPFFQKATYGWNSCADTSYQLVYRMTLIALLTPPTAMADSTEASQPMPSYLGSSKRATPKAFLLASHSTNPMEYSWGTQVPDDLHQRVPNEHCSSEVPAARRVSCLRLPQSTGLFALFLVGLLQPLGVNLGRFGRRYHRFLYFTSGSTHVSPSVCSFWSFLAR